MQRSFETPVARRAIQALSRQNRDSLGADYSTYESTWRQCARSYLEQLILTCAMGIACARKNRDEEEDEEEDEDETTSRIEKYFAYAMERLGRSCVETGQALLSVRAAWSLVMRVARCSLSFVTTHHWRQSDASVVVRAPLWGIAWTDLMGWVPLQRGERDFYARNQRKGKTVCAIGMFFLDPAVRRFAESLNETAQYWDSIAERCSPQPAQFGWLIGDQRCQVCYNAALVTALSPLERFHDDERVRSITSVWFVGCVRLSGMLRRIVLPVHHAFYDQCFSLRRRVALRCDQVENLASRAANGVSITSEDAAILAACLAAASGVVNACDLSDDDSNKTAATTADSSSPDSTTNYRETEELSRYSATLSAARRLRSEEYDVES